MLRRLLRALRPPLVLMALGLCFGDAGLVGPSVVKTSAMPGALSMTAGAATPPLVGFVSSETLFPKPASRPPTIGPLRALAPRPYPQRSNVSPIAAEEAPSTEKRQTPPVVVENLRPLSSHASPISPQLLTALIRACAPQVNPVTQAAVITVESSGDAWALHDDNDGRVYRPGSFRDAVRLATNLIAGNRQRYGKADAGVDVGVGQINSNNFANLGVDAGWMLHPCPNLRVSSTMIASAYFTQYAILASLPDPQRDQLAIRRALQIYNSGRPSGDESYVENVIGALHSPFVKRLQLASVVIAPTYPVDTGAAPRFTTNTRRSVSRQRGDATGLFVHEDPFAAPRQTSTKRLAPAATPLSNAAPSAVSSSAGHAGGVWSQGQAHKAEGSVTVAAPPTPSSNTSVGDQ